MFKGEKDNRPAIMSAALLTVVFCLMTVTLLSSKMVSSPKFNSDKVFDMVCSNRIRLRYGLRKRIT